MPPDLESPYPHHRNRERESRSTGAAEAGGEADRHGGSGRGMETSNGAAPALDLPPARPPTLTPFLFSGSPDRRCSDILRGPNSRRPSITQAEGGRLARCREPRLRSPPKELIISSTEDERRPLFSENKDFTGRVQSKIAHAGSCGGPLLEPEGLAPDPDTGSETHFADLGRTIDPRAMAPGTRLGQGSVRIVG